MALVVFLRAVNVGGRRVSAKGLADELGFLNLGAAGTFVAKKARSAAAITKAICERLPFDCDVMVVPGDDLLALVERDPFLARGLPEGARGYVTVLSQKPAHLPKLPIEAPPGSRFETRFFGVVGRFALSERIPRGGKRIVYPNELVEKALGIPATTRGWDTVLAIAKLLTA